MGLTMNGLVDKMVTSTGLPEKEVRKCVRNFVSIVQEELGVEDGAVTVPGLGTFKSVRKGGRQARNPRTGAKGFVDPYLKPVYKASMAMRNTVNHRGNTADDSAQV